MYDVVHKRDIVMQLCIALAIFILSLEQEVQKLTKEYQYLIL